MSKNKLTNQEIAAFLDNFDIADVRIRNVWSQKALFIVSFWFLNAYVLFYIIGHTAFPDTMMKFKHLIDLRDDYVALLNARSVVGLVLPIQYVILLHQLLSLHLNCRACVSN